MLTSLFWNPNCRYCLSVRFSVRHNGRLLVGVASRFALHCIETILSSCVLKKALLLFSKIFISNCVCKNRSIKTKKTLQKARLPPFYPVRLSQKCNGNRKQKNIPISRLSGPKTTTLQFAIFASRVVQRQSVWVWSRGLPSSTFPEC